jgi:hypothetical protein
MYRKDALIPRLVDIRSIDISEIKWVCIVEKEASFVSAFGLSTGHVIHDLPLANRDSPSFEDLCIIGTI